MKPAEQQYTTERGFDKLGLTKEKSIYTLVCTYGKFYITHTKIVPLTIICYIPNYFMIMK